MGETLGVTGCQQQLAWLPTPDPRLQLTPCPWMAAVLILALHCSHCRQPACLLPLRTCCCCKSASSTTLSSDGGGVSFVLKTGSGKWLQDDASNTDFYFPTAGKGGRWQPERAPRSAGKPSGADAIGGSSSGGGGGRGSGRGVVQALPRLTADQLSAPTQKKGAGDVAALASEPGGGGGSDDGSKRVLSQEERNRVELPDITKGVPWNPGEGPKGSGATLGNIVPMDARARPPWYTASIFGDVDEAAVKVCGEEVWVGWMCVGGG